MSESVFLPRVAVTCDAACRPPGRCWSARTTRRSRIWSPRRDPEGALSRALQKLSNPTTSLPVCLFILVGGRVASTEGPAAKASSWIMLCASLACTGYPDQPAPRRPEADESQRSRIPRCQSGSAQVGTLKEITRGIGKEVQDPDPAQRAETRSSLLAAAPKGTRHEHEHASLTRSPAHAGLCERLVSPQLPCMFPCQLPCAASAVQIFNKRRGRRGRSRRQRT